MQVEVPLEDLDGLQLLEHFGAAVIQGPQIAGLKLVVLGVFPLVYRFGKGHWRHDREEVPAGGMTGRGVHLVDAMQYLAGPIRSVMAQTFRLAQDFGVDDTTSMLFQFHGGATGYLGTVIATAETWRLQALGSSGWAELGGIEHTTTWQLKTCSFDPQNIPRKLEPRVQSFPETSTERSELEHFARAAMDRRALVVPGSDEVQNAAVLEAILGSAAKGVRQEIAASK